MEKKISADASPKETTTRGRARSAQSKKLASAEAAEQEAQGAQTADEAPATITKPARGRKKVAGETVVKTRTTRTRTKKSTEKQSEAAAAEDEAQPKAAEKRKTSRTRTTARKKAADQAGAGKLPSIFFEQPDGSSEPLLLNAETVPAVTMEVDEMLSAQAEPEEAVNAAAAKDEAADSAAAGEKQEEAVSQAPAEAANDTVAQHTADECATATHNDFASFSSLIKTFNHVAQEHPAFISNAQEEQVEEQPVQETAEAAAVEPENIAVPAEEQATAGEAAAVSVSQSPEPSQMIAQAPSGTAVQPAVAAAPMAAMPGMVPAAGAPVEDVQLTEVEYAVSEHVSGDEMHAIHVGDPSSFTMHCQYGDGKVERQVIGDSAGTMDTRPSEPQFANKFFRSCRSVISAEKVSTPMPEEGYWVPNHPAHRSSHYSQYRPAPAQIIHSPDLAAAQDAAPGSMLQGAPYSALPNTAAQLAGNAEGIPAAAGLTGTQPAQGTDTSSSHNVLICWVGKVDISAALRHDNINPGPIRMLLEHEPSFDHVLLLTTLNQSVLDTLSAWLAPCLIGKTLDIQHTKVPDLSDHMLVCQATVEAVEGVIKHYGLEQDGSGITFHLSPGSPVTHAILLLLSTIRYKGIRLMQTRLTGLGKAPDILTISIPDILNGPGINMSEVPEIDLPVADNATPAEISSTTVTQTEVQEQQEEEMARLAAKGRFGHKYASFTSKPKGTPLCGDDLLSRFKPTHKSQPAKTPHGRIQRAAAPQPQPAQEALPLELEIPVTPQEDNALRAPAGNIGKPSRISPTAMQPKEGEPPMISAALGSVYKKMQRVATMLLPILLLGESGCGKSRLASYIHEWSGRGGKFVSLDCAGLTDEMFVCELFGHRGGHGQPREGAFRRARSGTLFLENVNLLTPTQQSMLLRILAPVGETKLTLPARPPFPACSVRVRIIASADASLADDIREGRFRTDLYYRLAGVSTTLPPVREYTYTERENLLRSFLVSLQQKLGQCWNFSGDAWQTLLDEKWPGNLREVTRILQQVCLLSDSSATITREEVLQQLRQGRFLNTVHSHAEPVAAKADSFEAQFVQASQDPAFSPDAASFGPVIAGDDDMLDSPLDSQDSNTPAPGIEDFFELGSGQSLEKALEQARNNKILEAMERAKGNRNEAATLLGMTPGQLNYALHRMRQNDASE